MEDKEKNSKKPKAKREKRPKSRLDHALEAAERLIAAEASQEGNVIPEEEVGGEQSFQPDFRFDDRTILEANGEFQMVRRLMYRYGASDPWCVRTNLTLVHPYGVCQMTIEFTSGGNVNIVSFYPSNADPIANMDVRSLAAFALQNGWKRPEPTFYVIGEMKEFWKSVWQSNLVDSAVMDARYGERPQPMGSDA